MMKKQFALLVFAFLIITSCGNEDPPTKDDCGGQVCEATPGTDETSTTVPNSLNGTYNMVITYAESNSPYPEGTTATFIIAAEKLTVSIDGEDCFSIINPVNRSPFTAPTFKADCIGDIAFQVAANQSGGLEEINLILASGPGYYGQFRVQ
ncbi:hypothetical protein [uncultured Roseivirga sp.]|uniref:hypothetical protein n=1 Tax=uncultured Roseivirga sp. TaxID=543088 RepID=UPI0030DC8ECE|tara:strand:- start:3027 stop:3479 length:453 start_codon:yes stop_codon:yes gene_type:complete